MKGHLFPVALLAAVVALGASLVMVVTLRPWAGADESYNTHLNFQQGVPGDYGRTPLAWLGAESSTPMGWDISSHAPQDVDKAYALYVARGCASCHGFKGDGSLVGSDLLEASIAKIGKAVRRGPGGMPAYHEAHLADEELKLITDYLLKLQEAGATSAPTVTAPKTPTPTPTVVVATPTPLLTPTVVVPEDGTPTSTPTAAIATARPTSTAPATEILMPTCSLTPTPTAPGAAPSGPLCLQAAWTPITVDGNAADWAAIPGTSVSLTQVKPIPRLQMGKLAPMVVTLKVAVDSKMVYILLEVPDDYDWVPTDPYLSAKMSVMFRIDDPAEPHMGTTEEEQKKSLGIVDMWHWTLACGPGEVAGGGGSPSGKDAKCSLNDEWSTTPTLRKSDNTPQGENSVAGAWEHTGRTAGPGTPGTWIFELSRPLDTQDPQDARLTLGGKANVALAYWDPDETPDGWTEVGHVQSASPHGWIQVLLPPAAP